MTTALITGPTAGIGHAFARALARRGHGLVLVARNEQRLQAVAEELIALGATSTQVLAADLASDKGIAAVEDLIRSTPIDILVNNAGFGQRGTFLAAPLDDELAMLRVHTEVILRLTTAALPGMLERGKGDVINVASVGAFFPRGTYGASKSWAVTFSRGIAVDLAGKGIRIQALCPGFVRTEFHERAEMNVSAINDRMWLDADFVVAESLKDLDRGRIVSIPSRRYKLIVGAAKLLPARLSDRAARQGREYD